VLDDAADFHRKMYQAHQALRQELRDRMLVIAGVGFRTLFRLAYQPQFFGVWEYTAKITSRIQGDLHREGDGSVPLASAALDNVAIRYVRGTHGGLTNIPAIYNDVFHWLNEQSLDLPYTADGALSQHLGLGEMESEAPHLDGTARIMSIDDDPGVWDIATPDPLHLAALDAKLAEGQMPEFISVRLL
jgi:hypothetical protein